MNNYPFDYPTPKDFFDPDWSKNNKVHEWKNYISDDLVFLWDTFSKIQKAIIARNAQEMADKEDWE